MAQTQFVSQFSGSEDFDTFMQNLAENYNQQPEDGIFQNTRSNPTEFVTNDILFREYNNPITGSILPPDLTDEFNGTSSSENFQMYLDPNLVNSIFSYDQCFQPSVEKTRKKSENSPENQIDLPPSETTHGVFDSQSLLAPNFVDLVSDDTFHPNHKAQIKKETDIDQTQFQPSNYGFTPVEEHQYLSENSPKTSPSPPNFPSSPFLTTAASPHSPQTSNMLFSFCSTQSFEEQELKAKLAMPEILNLIGWNQIDSDSLRPLKRKRETDPIAIRQKHTEAEQKRRVEMNKSINDIARLLPSFYQEQMGNIDSNSERDNSPTESKKGSKDALNKQKTKLAILVEAADYFKRIQLLCSHLVFENKALKEELSICKPRDSSFSSSPSTSTSSPSVSPSLSIPPLSSSNCMPSMIQAKNSNYNPITEEIELEDTKRLTKRVRSNVLNGNLGPENNPTANRSRVKSKAPKKEQKGLMSFQPVNPQFPLNQKVFLVFLFCLAASFSPFQNLYLSSGSKIVGGREILNFPLSSPSDDIRDVFLLVSHYALLSLPSISFFLLSVYSIVFLTHRYFRLWLTSEKDIHAAREEIITGFLQRDQGKIEEAWMRFTRALELLNVPVPDSLLAIVVATLFELIRKLSHSLGVGFFFERYLLGLKKTNLEILSEAAKAYSGMLLPYADFYKGPVQYLYLTLCAINSATLSKDYVSLANIWSEISFKLSSHPNIVQRSISNYSRTKAYKIVETLKDSKRTEIANLFYVQGVIYFQNCNFEKSQFQLKKAIQLFHDSDPQLECISQISLAAVKLFEGELHQTLQIFVHLYKSCTSKQPYAASPTTPTAIPASFLQASPAGNQLDFLELDRLQSLQESGEVDADRLKARMWSLLGISSCFIHMGEFQKSLIVLKHTVITYQKHFTTTEEILSKILLALTHCGLKDYELSFQYAQQVLTDSKNYVGRKLFVIGAFYSLADCFLELFEASQQISSVLHSRTGLLCTLSQEVCSLLEKHSVSIPLMRVMSGITQARFWSLVDPHKSHQFISCSLKEARKLKWKYAITQINNRFPTFREDQVQPEEEGEYEEFYDDDDSDEDFVESSSSSDEISQ